MRFQIFVAAVVFTASLGLADAQAMSVAADSEAAMQPDETATVPEAMRPPAGQIVSLGPGDAPLTASVLRWTDSSADGNLVAFATAEDLSPNSPDSHSDVFIRNRNLSVVHTVSVALNGNQANGESVDPSVSADGRYVAFASAASNLVPGDTNGKYDVFVRDLVLNSTKRVSLTASNAQANGHSHTPQISNNGKVVVFLSGATNLVTADKGFHRDVFARDLSANTTQLISTSTTGTGGNNHSLTPSVDASGRWIVFNSTATNLSARADLGVYLRDRTAARPSRLPQRTISGKCNNQPFSHAETVLPIDPAISANGRYLSLAVTQKSCISDNGAHAIADDDVLLRFDRTTTVRTVLRRESQYSIDVPDYDCSETIYDRIEGPLQISNSGATYTFATSGDYSTTCSLSAGGGGVSYMFISSSFTSVIAGCYWNQFGGDCEGALSLGAALHPTQPSLLFVTGEGVGDDSTGGSAVVYNVTFP